MDEGSRELFQRLRTPGVGERLIIEENFFVETVLPAGVLRTLSPQELDAYRSPYRDPAARLPVWRIATALRDWLSRGLLRVGSGSEQGLMSTAW
jgi:hypothetical protein